jgi:hypothetical protein
MVPTHSLKKPFLTTSALKSLLRPMLIGSLALHSLIIFVPNLANQKSKVPSDPAKLEKVKIRDIPKQKVVKIQKPKQAKPAIQKQPASPIKSNVPPAPPGDPAPSSTDAFADFPQYPNSQIGSLGLFKDKTLDESSFQTADTITQVSTFFEKTLATLKHYKVQPELNTPERKVYQVIQGETVRFLNLMTRPEGTVILLADGIIDPSKLQNVGSISPEEDSFYQVMSQIQETLGPEEVIFPENQLTNPGAFYQEITQEDDGTWNATLRDEVTATPLLFLGGDHTQLFNAQLASQFSGFATSQIGSYEGGPVYAVQKGDFVRYVSIVNDATGKGAILTIWKTVPAN